MPSIVPPNGASPPDEQRQSLPPQALAAPTSNPDTESMPIAAPAGPVSVAVPWAKPENAGDSTPFNGVISPTPLQRILNDHELTDDAKRARIVELRARGGPIEYWLIPPHLTPPPAPPASQAEHLANFAKYNLQAEEKKLEREQLKAGIGATARPGTLDLRTADRVVFESVWWLWPGYLACSFLNLVVGETSAGKSTVLADVAARVTTGAPWPGEPADARRTPGRVLWLGSEDPFEILTGPRLVACGADLRMVTEIRAVQRAGKVDGFSMQDDIGAVKAELMAAKQFGGAYAMLIIDPVTSYLQGGRLRKVDMNDSGQLRAILEPWVRLAQETGIAIVAVTHLAKDTTRSMLHRVLGGGAFAHLSRSLIAVVNMPDQGPNEKAVLQVKSNLPGLVRGAWRFRTELKHIANDQFNRPITASCPAWISYDHSLTPESIAGGQRGPASKQAPAFGIWLRSLFVNADAERGLPITQVKAIALDAKVVTARWWDDHSGEYLDKRNVSGVWWCRPKGG